MCKARVRRDTGVFQGRATQHIANQTSRSVQIISFMIPMCKNISRAL